MSEPTKEEEAEEGSERLSRDDRESLAEFLAQFSGGGHQFPIFRLEPKHVVVRGEQKRISGHLTTLSTAPTPDELKQMYGGGLFEVRIMTKGPKARVIACRKVEIAGDPKLEEPPPPAAPAQAGPPPELIERVLDHAFSDKRQAEERLDRERLRLLQAESARKEEPTADPALWQTTLGAIERSASAQLAMLKDQLERRDRDLGELRQQMEGVRQRRSTLEDPEVLKILFGRASDDTWRREEAREASAERERAAIELSAERERAAREVANERERAERDLAAERREHEMALQMIDRLHATQMESLRAANMQLLTAKDDAIARLNEELRAAKAQNRPHDTLTDLERMGKVVSAVRDFVPGMGEAAGASGWERFFDKAQPLVERVIERAARQPTGPTMSRLPMPMPMPTPWPRGRFPAGVMVPMPGAAAPVMESALGTTATTPPTITALPDNAAEEASVPVSGLPATGPETATSLGEIGQGIPFLEAAYQNGHAPTEVARSALSMFGKSELAVLVEAGHETIAAEIAKALPASPLGTRGGRRYLRELIESMKTQLAEPAPK